MTRPADWDSRYAAADLVWGAGANRYVVEHTGDLPPGRAVDLACGEGRNAIHLARRGWRVRAVDFSPVAIDKARRLEATIGYDDVPGETHPVEWITGDATDFRPDPADLALVVYLHLPPRQRRTVLRHACAALPGAGRILVVGHHIRNIAEGTGGPQNPDILYTAADIVGDLGVLAPDMRTEVAAEPLRQVVGAERPAIDTVVLARRP
jgi:SAM-dependent methyltransferase